MLATLSGSVDQELLLRNEYLVAENRILKNQIKKRLRLTDPEGIQRSTGSCFQRPRIGSVKWQGTSRLASASADS